MSCSLWVTGKRIYFFCDIDHITVCQYCLNKTCILKPKTPFLRTYAQVQTINKVKRPILTIFLGDFESWERCWQIKCLIVKGFHFNSVCHILRRRENQWLSKSLVKLKSNKSRFLFIFFSLWKGLFLNWCSVVQRTVTLLQPELMIWQNQFGFISYARP